MDTPLYIIFAYRDDDQKGGSRDIFGTTTSLEYAVNAINGLVVFPDSLHLATYMYDYFQIFGVLENETLLEIFAPVEGIRPDNIKLLVNTIDYTWKDCITIE